MTDIRALRPLISDSLDKFRFGTSAFLLRHASTVISSNASFVKHLADIYDNLNITMSSPESPLRSITDNYIPIIGDNISISEIEKHHYADQKRSFAIVVAQIDDSAKWRSVGYLLKTYYCLSNGYNYGAIACFAKAIDPGPHHLELRFPNAAEIHSQIVRYMSASLKERVDGDGSSVNFSFYMEYERARTWIRDQFGIDVYEIQKNITPRFRFGGE